ncbi:MAG: hypothetical protein AABX80_02325 [Nanoarchaeota archaeon]
MGALDQIRQMKREGFSEQEISDRLQEQGISPNSITDAFSQARIKDVVEGENEMQENDFPPERAPGEPETYAPQAQYYPPQEPYYSQPQETESYSPQEGYGESQGGFGTDTIIEIAEQVFEEKIKKLSQQISNFKEFSAIAETKFSNYENRLKRIESIIENLQIKILEKIGSYGNGLESIKKEMSMMQDSFSKTLPMLAKPFMEKSAKKISAPEKEKKNSK